jgi:hypothetical protein
MNITPSGTISPESGIKSTQFFRLNSILKKIKNFNYEFTVPGGAYVPHLGKYRIMIVLSR